ncbi:MAG: hypothetical protein SGJ27_21940 [Candidatus Melainabacteria bacterium]|nr:hypothetical protein [Candidatus Melainabacteria bacterium]
MKKTLISMLAMSLLVELTVAGCGVAPSSAPSEHYVSSQVKGESAKINLDEVKTAFWDTKGKDFNEWMGAFEKKVNEIYEGKGVVSIDANRKTGKLEVTGYIDDEKEQGYQSGEEKLFTIEQTGDVTTNKELPYTVAGHNGQPYYSGSHSILDNPFVQMMVLSHVMGGMGGWGGRYNTPYGRTADLRNHRDTFRTSPGFGAQKAANSTFNTRYKANSAGSGFASKKGFGTSSYSSTTGGTAKRSWGGFGSSSSPSSSSSGSVWGGRRSSSPSFGGGKMRWGGRRR